MAIAVSEIRSRVAASLEGLSGWTESRWAPGLYGRDTDHLMHHSFCIEVESTSIHPRTAKQRISQGALVNTTVTVQWAHRIRQDAQVSDYGLALDAEAAAIVAVMGVSREDLHIRLQDTRRRTTDEGWMLGTMRFFATHHLALV